MSKENGIVGRYRTETGQVDTAKLKRDVDIVEVAGWLTKLRRTGEAHRGLCPLHEENSPSFHVNGAKQLFYCFGCRAGGDVIDLVRLASRSTFAQACEWLVGSERTCPPSSRRTVVRAAGLRQSAIAQAKTEWRSARPIAGTVAELYLASRGIVGLVPASIRFGMIPRWFDFEHDRHSRRLPAMVAACQDPDGAVTGIQRLFLDAFGRKASGGEPRLSLGQIRGGALRLGPPSGTVMLTEGLEDGLSLMRMFPGRSVWAALGTANLPHVNLPPTVRRLTLAGDADGPGQAAVETAAVAYRDRGLDVDIILPKAGCKDFNEEWLLLHR